MIAFKSQIRSISQHFGLVLNAKHIFECGDPDSSIKFISRLPPDTAVYAAQTITLRLSGLLNKERVSSTRLAASHLSRHLVDYLEMANAISLFASVQLMHALERRATGARLRWKASS